MYVRSVSTSQLSNFLCRKSMSSNLFFLFLSISAHAKHGLQVSGRTNSKFSVSPVSPALHIVTPGSSTPQQVRLGKSKQHWRQQQRKDARKQAGGNNLQKMRTKNWLFSINQSYNTTAVFWLAYLHKSGSDVSHWLNLPLLWAAAGNTNTTPDFSILFSDTVSILINWIARTSQWIIWPNRVMLAASSITITTVWSQSYCFNQWLRCCSGRCKFRSQ